MSTKMIKSANYVHSYEWDVSEALWGKDSVLNWTEMHFF